MTIDMQQLISFKYLRYIRSLELLQNRIIVSDYDPVTGLDMKVAVVDLVTGMIEHATNLDREEYEVNTKLSQFDINMRQEGKV